MLLISIGLGYFLYINIIVQKDTQQSILPLFLPCLYLFIQSFSFTTNTETSDAATPSFIQASAMVYNTESRPIISNSFRLRIAHHVKHALNHCNLTAFVITNLSFHTQIAIKIRR